MTFTCHLADGSERTHKIDIDIGQGFDEAKKTVLGLIWGINKILQGGEVLALVEPLTFYAPGQVRYVDIDFAEKAREIRQTINEDIKAKLGFIKD
jgi:hypothetical protein